MASMDSAEGQTVAREEVPKLGHSAFLGKKAVLVVLSEAQFGQARVVDTTAFTVGRGKDCSFQVHDPLASAEHCRIVYNAREGYFIEDTSSTNGTFVNARRITQSTRLQYGDRIVIGSTIVRFYLEETLEGT
jgi:pSer/pThr/pTyr-binding forkhead associated (FHA) protein